MLIDMHAHTSGISRCCHADAGEVMIAANSAGIGGLILCNHYQKEYVEGSDAAAFARRYVDEYIYAEKQAAAAGVKLFFGVEVTAKLHGNAHILLYGLTPDFVLRHPAVYEYPLERMRALANAEGGLAVQAHPFRGGGHVLNTAHLDGIEVNCHPLYDDTHCEEILDIADREGLLVTCGGDYHADTYRAICGTYFPDDARDNPGIVDYLKKTDTIRLHVHELRTEFHRDVEFAKRR